MNRCPHRSQLGTPVDSAWFCRRLTPGLGRAKHPIHYCYNEPQRPSFLTYTDVHALRCCCCVCLFLTQSKENLTSLTEATNGLKSLDFYIGEKDYQSLRLALRNPPIGNLRSSARKVIIGIDNKDAEEKVCVRVCFCLCFCMFCVCERERWRQRDFLLRHLIACDCLEINLPTDISSFEQSGI